MLQKLAVSVLAVFLVVGQTAVAQEVKKEVKKEIKKEVKKETVVNDAKKEIKPSAVTGVKKDPSKPAKLRTMKWTSCSSSGCGFWVKSRSAKELRYIMKRHSRIYHKIALNDQQLKEMVKKEGTK